MFCRAFLLPLRAMNRFRLNIVAALLLLLTGFTTRTVAQTPRLVVQIVVGSLSPDALDRYNENFSEGGFNLLSRSGVVCENTAYDYQQTLTPVSLATITTGAMPTTHGVVGGFWWDFVDNSRISLIEDRKVVGLEYHRGGGNYSPRRLIAPTIGETLSKYSPQSRIVTIAMEPEGAVVMGGKAGYVFWMSSDLCHWRSSSYYMPLLPDWVKQYNKSNSSLGFILQPWSTLHPRATYLNTRRSDILLTEPKKRPLDAPEYKSVRDIECDLVYSSEYDRLLYTPAGVTSQLNFAKNAITKLELGKDQHPDLLSIYLDSPKMVAQVYGPESIEYEDMLYRLDSDLADFMTYVKAQVEGEDVLFVLTSDHGTSASYDITPIEQERFNIAQYMMIVESFMDARYGKDTRDWALGYNNKMVYLNHNLIYEKGLSLADVQNEIATFSMQFRGVSHALSATAMRMSYFGSGYARMMQNSFYPRHSGDVILNLMPGWIEKQELTRSSSGSMYGYDRRVPLMLYHPSISPQRIEEQLSPAAVAPTLARILDIPHPDAAEYGAIEINLNRR